MGMGDLPQLAVKKYVCWHGIQYFFRECELFAISREYGLLVWIPKSSHPIIFFKHPPNMEKLLTHKEVVVRREVVRYQPVGSILDIVKKQAVTGWPIPST